MSFLPPSETGAVHVRAADAEVIGAPPTTIRLLVDAHSADGAMSTQRVTLGPGADGATPHHHAGSAELFYVLSGTVQVLAGEQVLTATEGDVLVVPAGQVHAFAAAPGESADLLIVIAPGVERFEYFRLLARVLSGQASRQELLDTQERFDTWFTDSEAWRAARAG
ncbi:cupin domain-containing protein [Actinocatenispora rupis]|uniref:Cupin n=1 Tax=Actinocatenispora rupis TaxID=519421 RepID=A0A8J3IZ46_9ACTN|nr:cupin domain-containing protein [Actinocatenispora rupis]GID12701.1 cupin [Actinocatenispora rupis]